MIINDDLEKCELCGSIVHVENQYLGICNQCSEQLGLTTCEKCGLLYRAVLSEDLEDYVCPVCRLDLASQALPHIPEGLSVGWNGIQ